MKIKETDGKYYVMDGDKQMSGPHMTSDEAQKAMDEMMGTKVKKEQEVRLVKNDSKHIIKCAVYVPYLEDTQGDFMSAEEIEKMAYGFMKNMNLHNVDKGHDFDPDEGYVCESYIVQKNDPDGFTEGTWVVAIKVEKEETWAEIENGDITGVSLAGFAGKVVKHDTVPIPN